MIFFFGRKKKAKGLKERYYERLYEIFEWGERLKREIHSMEREREELRAELLAARRRGDKDRVALLETELEELSNRILKLKRLLKVIETERKRLEREGSYADVMVVLKRIEGAMRENLTIMSDVLRPQAEMVLDRVEETLAQSRSAKLPEPESDFIMKMYNGKSEAYATQPAQLDPAPQPVLVVDGMVTKYKFEDIVDKVYKVIEAYVKLGYKDKLSVKRIAQHVGVSEEEVRKALEVLERQGRIRIRRSKA